MFFGIQDRVVLLAEIRPVKASEATEQLLFMDIVNTHSLNPEPSLLVWVVAHSFIQFIIIKFIKFLIVTGC